MAIQFRGRGNPKNRVKFAPAHVQGAKFRHATGSAQAPCKLCALPTQEKLRLDWLLLSGCASLKGAPRHQQHLANEITNSKKYRDGTYGDQLLGKIEWAMQQMKEIALELRERDPKNAIVALRNLGDIAATQAKIIGLAVPRTSSTKNSLHLHLGKDVKPADVSRAIDAYQRTQLNQPDAAPAITTGVVELEPERTDD